MARQSEIAEYSYCSLVDIQSWSGMPRGRPLFESVVVAENYPKPDPVMAAGCGLELSDFRSYVQNNYPLTLRVSAVDRCEFQLLFDSSRVAQGVVPVLLTQLQALLRKARNLMAGRISDAVEIIHTAEQEQCRTAGRSILSDIRRRKENRNQTVEKSECTRSA
jgi:microcystin synthetase protein McyB